MKFYDMVSNIDELYNKIPQDISDKLDELKISEFNNINDENIADILDNIWDIAIRLCENYVNTKWIKNLGIDMNELFKDIKMHSIFTMYLSSINQTLEGKSIEECANESYEMLHDNECPEKFVSDIKKEWEKCLESFNNSQYNKDKRNSDFYNCFYKETNNDDELVFLDPLIFCEVILNWNNCIYNNTFKSGIDFKRLYKLYNELRNIIKITDNEFEKIVNGYVIERFFNIAFISDLSNYLNSLIDKRDIGDKKDELYIKENNKKLIKREKQEIKYWNYNMNLAGLLVALSKIASSPMVFSRTKYIEIIKNKWEKNISNPYWLTRLENNFYYLNSCLIPILVKVYYSILDTYTMTRCCNNKNIGYTLDEILKGYIMENRAFYSYKKFLVKDEHRFVEIFEKQFQINITEMVYNYSWTNVEINSDENIFGIMEELEGNINSQVCKGKYNYDVYYYNFPENRIYLGSKYKYY